MACSTPASNRTQTDRQTDKIEHDVRAKWDTNKRVQFINNLDDEVMDRLDAQVKHLLDTDTLVNLNDVDSVVTDICNVFINSAKKTNMVKTYKHTRKRKVSRPNYKPWFNVNCRHKRSLFYKARAIQMSCKKVLSPELI